MSELEPIITRKNQYRGVNPHLQDFLTEVTEFPLIWPSFHASHATHITQFLNDVLPDHHFPLTLPSLAPYEEEFQEFIDPEEDFIRATVIHEMIGIGKVGRALARIEVLSPANKPGGSVYSSYQKGRIETLTKGIPLVEIDYIHEQAPVLPAIPRYPNDSYSYPYMICVSDPRATLREGQTTIYVFDVDTPIPAISLPLLSDEVVTFDLNPIYQHTFRTGRWGFYVDYRDTPLRLHTYSLADQTRIQQRMAAIAEAYTQGIDLEQ